MKQITLKIEENLNKLLEERINTFKENFNLDMSKNRALIKILTHALINDDTFEEILLSHGRNKPKDQLSESIKEKPDKPIDKPDKPLKEIPGAAKLFYEVENAGYIGDDLTYDQQVIAWRALPEIIPELYPEQYIEEPDLNEPY